MWPSAPDRRRSLRTSGMIHSCDRQLRRVGTTDQAGRRRLRRVARLCQDHGVRVQYSVFECRLAPAAWIRLRSRLIDNLYLTKDSLRIDFIDEGDAGRTEHHGLREPLDLEGPLVF